MYNQAPYGYPQPPRKRHGLKRTIFGGLGIVANAIGLIVMPIIAGVVGAVIAVGGGDSELAPLDPDRGTFQATSWSIYTIAVPQEDLDSVTCEITGMDVSVEPGDPSFSSGQVDGVTYYDLYDVQVFGDQEVTVDCEGGEAIAVWEAGMGVVLVSLGIGLVLPIGLGLVSIALTIWGIIALVRSR